MLQYLPKPKFSFIQWHITERCNLRCKHCYQTSYNTPELSYDKLLDIFYQYLELLDMWGIKGRIQITGGEPFIRERELFDLLEKCYENKDKLEYGIMSNGMFATREIARRLKNLQLDFFQVSLEGKQTANDYIRGVGTFEKITEGAKILLEEGVRTSISFTSSKANWHEFKDLVEVGKDIGVNVVWSDRLVPWGVGAQMREQMLAPLELKTHYERITSISKELDNNNKKTRVPLRRTLYFLADCDCKAGSDRQYACDVVGTTGMTIMPDGIVYPCRRLAVKVGNLKEESLFEIWYGNDFMWKLRDKNYYRNSKCGSCEFFEKCTTGSMCVTYGYCGTPFATDPQCWKAFKELPNPEELREDAKKAEALAEEMEPDFWDNIVVPQGLKNELGSYIEIKDNKYYFNNGKKLELTFCENEVKNGENLYLKIDIDKVNLSILLKELIKLKPNFLLLSLSFKNNDVNNAKNILEFLKSLKANNIYFEVDKPLPRCLFDTDYYETSREFNLPTNFRDCIGMFRINDGFIEFGSPLNKKCSKLKYLRDRDQIYEYFEILYHNLQKNKDNINKHDCIYSKRGMYCSLAM